VPRQHERPAHSTSSNRHYDLLKLWERDVRELQRCVVALLVDAAASLRTS
jgi:hypothetical protein